MFFCLTASAAEKKVYLFFSPTCPHCQHEIEFLTKLQKDHPKIAIEYIEVSKNHKRLEKFCKRYGTNTKGVPRTFVGDKAFIGFTEESGTLETLEGDGAYYGYKNQLEKSILTFFGIDANTPPK
jgi:thiol-disulfide isomerase/thioredoxin